MKIDHIFVVMAVCACFVLFGIFYCIAVYRLSVDWESVSNILLGFYLYLSYLMLNLLYGNPRKKDGLFRGSILHEKDPDAHRNEVYEP